jgi:Glycosyl transferase family 2
MTFHRIVLVASPWKKCVLGDLRSNTVFLWPQIRCEVDVILPCYNVQPYLPRALASVFSQSFTGYRVCAVDDGSTDGTIGILERNAHRCTLTRQPRRGAAAARNLAIRMSDSPFIAFLDADDEWLPDKLQRQVGILKENPSLGLVCSLCAFEHRRQHAAGSASQSMTGSTGKLFLPILRDCFVFTPTVVVRRQCLEEIGLFNEALSVSEDFNLWLRIAARWEIALLPEVLAVTHTRPGGLSQTTSSQQRAADAVAALEHVRHGCPGLADEESRALRKALALRHYTYGSLLLSSGAASASRRQFISALKLDPILWKSLAKLGLSLFSADARKSAFDPKAKSLPASTAPIR